MKKSTLAFMTAIVLIAVGTILTSTLGARIPSVLKYGEPAVVYFRAEPFIVLPGQPSTLRWKVKRATDVTITAVRAHGRMVKSLCEERLGKVDAEGGLNVCPSETSTYLLMAYGPGGEYATQSTIVSVIDPPDANLGIRVAR